jgi:hypothetical protein
VVATFESDDMGTREHFILGVRIDATVPAKLPAEYVRSRLNGAIRTDNGLTLGMPVAELKARMSTPVKAGAGRDDFEYDLKVRDRKAPARGVLYDRLASLHVGAPSGRVTTLAAWCVTAS